MKKIFNILKIIISLSIIIILIIVIYFKFIKKNKIIDLFGYKFLIVLTGSMEPEIEAGSFVIIKKCKDYNINEIITYEENSSFITHRIIKKI